MPLETSPEQPAPVRRISQLLAQWIGRLGPVYTPPEHRGHGYAAAVTAAATQAVLDAGGRGVMLFTDRANPTSRGVYARLGYREVGGVVEWEFDGPQADGGHA